MFNHLADGLPTWWDICDLVIVTDTLERVTSTKTAGSVITLSWFLSRRLVLSSLSGMIEVIEHKLDYL